MTYYTIISPNTIKVGALNTFVPLDQTLVCSDSDSSLSGLEINSSPRSTKYRVNAGGVFAGSTSVTNISLDEIKLRTTRVQVKLDNDSSGTVTLTELVRGYTKTIKITL